MAKNQIKTKSIEEALWESANKLRGSVEPSEYKHVVLSLIFLKYADDRFVERREELIADGKGAFVDQAVFYNAKNVFFLGETSRWSFIMENAKQNDIAVKIDAALAAIEKENPALKGALPSNYYSGLGLDRTKLAALLDEINTEKKSFKDLGISYEEKAFYDILKSIAKKFGFDYPEEKLVALAAEIKKIVDDKARYADWAQREDIKAALKMDLILILDAHGYPPVTNDEVFKEIFEQAENFKKHQCATA